jgi:hypothetical protein
MEFYYTEFEPPNFLIQRLYIPLTRLNPPTTSTATPRPNRTQQYTVRYTTYHSTTVCVSLLCDNKPNFYFIFLSPHPNPLMYVPY